MSDPTYGRIDADIQAAVEEMKPKNLAQRVAIENTMQRRRDDGLVVLGVEPGINRENFERCIADPPTTAYRIGWWTHKWWPTRRLLACFVTGRQPGRYADGSIRRVGRKPYAQALWRRIRLIRRPHRPWQAEMLVPRCSCNARRAFTADGAVKRVKALHARRMAEPFSRGTSILDDTRGKCWASLTDEERAQCR